MKKIILLLFPLLSLLSACSSGKLASIDQVAQSNMIVLQQNEQWRLFQIKLSSTQTLGDHRSGSRIIVSLSPIKIQRITGDSSIIEIEKYKALWLTNPISKGIINVSQHPMEYLVLEAKNPNQHLVNSERTCQEGTTLIAFESLIVCKIINEEAVQPLKYLALL